MELEAFKKKNLHTLQHIEVSFFNEDRVFKRMCGYFLGLDEHEIPEHLKYRYSHPVEPPFITVAYALDSKWRAKETKYHSLKDIEMIRTLEPEYQI